MAHTLYDNFVLANKVEDFLSTNVDMMNYATADYSLTEEERNKIRERFINNVLK